MWPLLLRQPCEACHEATAAADSTWCAGCREAFLDKFRFHVGWYPYRGTPEDDG